MSDTGEFGEVSRKSIGVEITSYDDFFDVLESASADEGVTWFSFCSSGIKRSNQMNQAFDDLAVVSAKDKNFSKYNKGKSYTDAVVLGVGEDGVFLEDLDKPVKRLIVFAVFDAQIELAKIKLEDPIESYTNDMNSADVKIYYVRLEDHMVRKTINDWVLKHSQNSAA